jgi:hypothetical protein
MCVGPLSGARTTCVQRPGMPPLTQLGHESRHKRKRLWSCKCEDCHRLSRHAIRYKGDLRTSSAVLDRPMSASRWSSSFSRSCLRWYRRSQPSAIPASHASGIFQDLLRLGNKGEAASRLLVEFKVVLPQDMFHLHNGAKQRLAAGAHRAVVNGPSAFCIIPMPFGNGQPLAHKQCGERRAMLPTGHV